MKHFKKIRIEMIVEEAVAEAMIEQIQDAGAKGYTQIHDVSGSGNRGVRLGDPVSGVGGNVQLIVVADAAIAETIIEEGHRLLEHYAGIIMSSEVEVLRDEHF